MKIKPEHYRHMQIAMCAAQALQPEATRAAYEAKGLSAKRHRWDLSYAAGLSSWIGNNVYTYADDTHLDTAFRSIVKDMEIQSL
jgi:hypothetical protein